MKGRVIASGGEVGGGDTAATELQEAGSLEELYDEGVFVGLAVAFLDSANNGQDQPRDPYDGVEGKKDKSYD